MRKVRVTRDNYQSADGFSSSLKRILDHRLEPWSKFDEQELSEIRSKIRKKAYQRNFLP